jgi:tetratricopeptide repeat protein 21B
MIYVNPSRKYVWCEMQPLASAKDLESTRRFLGKLNSSVVDVTQFDALLLLSENTTDSVTNALVIYENGNDDDLAAALGKCRCYLRLGRQRDATRNLNGIIHREPTHSTFDIFVESFIMMTHISIKENQMDEAEKYVQWAIEIDRGSVKAWDMKGTLADKRKDHSAAVDAFRRGWTISEMADLAVGYKLAVSCMRAHDPVEAIKVARIILQKHPG